MTEIVMSNNFKESFGQIKTYLQNNPNLSKEDYKRISELLHVLKYVVQFNILEQCFHRSSALASVVADIDRKLASLQREQELLLKEPNTKIFRRLVAIKNNVQELNKLKESINRKDFRFFVQDMNAGLKNSEELIAACSAVLSQGQEDYVNLFGKDVVRDKKIGEEGINVLFGILTNPLLKRQLKSFLMYEKQYNELREERDEDAKFLDYIRLAKKYEESLREYLSCAKSDLKSDIYLRNKEEVLSGELALNEIPTEGLAGILNKKRREKVEADLEKAKRGVRTYQESMTKRINLERILVEAGLGPIIDVYFKSAGDIGSIEERVVTFIKSTMNRQHFNIEAAEGRLVARLEELDGLLASEKIKLESLTLDPQARQYISLNYADVVRVLDIMDAKDSQSFSPLLAAYILKILSDVKNLDYEEILGICALDLDPGKLFQTYLTQMEASAKSYHEQLIHIDEIDQETVSPGSFGVK